MIGLLPRVTKLMSHSPVKQLVRFVIEQYRDELITSLQGSVDEEKRNEDREVVARDLLNILHSIPIQSIATNGPSLVCYCCRCYAWSIRILIRAQVHKVRFVASTLLDAVRKVETAPASAARAHGYLCEPRIVFLRPTCIFDKSSRGLSIYSFRN